MAGVPHADGQRTRAAILRQAVDLATVNGLEGLTIGDLAGALSMSKSGLYAHFKSKEALQLAAVEEANRIFDEQVVAAARQVEPGVDSLVAVCDAFFAYLEGRVFPGGCFFAVTSMEMGRRSGQVKDFVAHCQGGFVNVLRENAVEAIQRGQLPATEDPEALAFELNGVILAAQVHFVLHDNKDALDMARKVVRRRLGVTVKAKGVTVKAKSKAKSPR